MTSFCLFNLILLYSIHSLTKIIVLILMMKAIHTYSMMIMNLLKLNLRLLQIMK